MRMGRCDLRQLGRGVRKEEGGGDRLTWWVAICKLMLDLGGS